MRTLLIADIHSNWCALRAVAEDCGDFDDCICLGDIVEYGTDPVPCIDWVQQHAVVCIRGNHDHAVAQRVPPRGGPGLRRLAAATRGLHWDQLDPSRLKYLSRLPMTRRQELQGRDCYFVHATPRDPLDEYLGDDPDAWRQRLSHIRADLVCVGHSHVPFELESGAGRVVNPGSVGQPRDGDPRAAYALIEDGRITFHRVEYDIDEVLRQMQHTPVEPWVIDLTAAVLRSGGQISREAMDRIV
jgi:putative phosphoesterase